MFTATTFVALAVVAWLAQRKEAGERAIKLIPVDDAFLRERILFIREDIRLLAFLLMAVLVMLGIIADRLH
jgi:hypothetical protein